MLYYLFKYLQEAYNLTGAGVFQYISFRAGIAVITALLISAVLGKKIIEILRRKQMKETVRDLGLQGQLEKQGTPTMGGLIIIAAILIPTLLFTKVFNIYVLLMLLVTVWMGAIGFLDDYIKTFKGNKEGLPGKFKVFGQVALGLIVSIVFYCHEDVVVRQEFSDHIKNQIKTEKNVNSVMVKNESGGEQLMFDTKAPITTIPFFKNNEFNYGTLISWITEDYMKWSFIVFIPIVIFIITAVSNGANITDGLDGLATGNSAIIVATLAIFAYVSGNVVFSQYLNIMYIPNAGELVVFSAAFIGACAGFLWYNAYPAQVFMGDTGSLTIGGIIAVLAIMIRKELLLPVLCGVFLIENLSVIIQVGYFKYTKKKFGEGIRIFKMAPLHHHYQKLGFHETKIVTRFWLVGVLLAALTILTLKLR